MKNEQAYFLVKPWHHRKYDMLLLPYNGDLLPLARVDNTKIVYPTQAGVVPGYEDVILVCAIIGPELQLVIEDLAEVDAWDGYAAVFGIGVENIYAGRALNYETDWGVFDWHPGLDGQVQTGLDEETGFPVMTDIVSRTVWP